MPKKGHIPLKDVDFPVRGIPEHAYSSLRIAAASVGWSTNKAIVALLKAAAEKPEKTLAFLRSVEKEPKKKRK